ncbi:MULTISPECIES: MerR family DNA-binding transcriptional regulator [Asaia]|uniref:MerR family DNA-binding transcriptional regulator n=1 Tax=Asaia TaxID=91914 RepID=UPI002555DB0D|nr:MerR family DNA-binding transcriptional regulator [Asaia sp. HumB]MDL2170003.1 MerR family DNA-binding transcriptional regulator [Asaia sp. HumB]
MRDRSIGEMAAQSGLSVRSLRHLEEKGLIAPRRTEAGRRVYGAREVNLITKILPLRQAEYRLSEISAVMIAPSLDARSLIETQILHLGAKQREIETMLRRLRHMSDLLETRETPDADRLCSLIKEAQTIMTQQDLRTVAKQYFIEEEWDRWQTLGARLFPGETRTAYEQNWAALITRVADAIRQGVAPGSPKALSLLGEWMTLQQPMVDALGKEHWDKAAKMYADMESWQAETARAPFSAEVYRFMTETGRLSCTGGKQVSQGQP